MLQGRWLTARLAKGRRGPRLCLIGAIDDATGKVSGAFDQADSSWGSLRLFAGVFRCHELPQAIYSDRHSGRNRSSVVRSCGIANSSKGVTLRICNISCKDNSRWRRLRAIATKA